MAEVRALGTPRGRRRYGWTALEGLRVVERAWRAGCRPHFVLADARFLRTEDARSRDLREGLETAGVELIPVPDDTFSDLTDGRDLGGLIAAVDLPHGPPLSTLVSTPGPRALFLACLSVLDPGNLGALARTAHAAGARALLLAASSDPFHPRAVRTSMGSLFRLPVVEWSRPVELFEALAEQGVKTVGAVTQGGVPMQKIEPGDGPLAVLLGSEAHGLQPAELERLDGRVTLPMADGVDSLSINAAAAVLLYGLRDSGQL